MNKDIHPDILLPAHLFADEPSFILIGIISICIIIFTFVLARKAVLFISIYKYQHIDSSTDDSLKKSTYSLHKEPVFIALNRKGLIDKLIIDDLNKIKYQENFPLPTRKFNSIIKSIALSSLRLDIW